MSSLLFAEIAATCNALGYSDGAKYFTDPQCEEAVKDLIRYLRRDDENHEIRRHLGEAKIVQTDLLPILKDHWKQTELFDHVLRLLVNLTYPALVLYNAELPEDKTARFYYLQIISHLQSYKEAFIDDVVWAILCKKIGELLNIEWQDRSEEQGKVIERILTLVRNVLQVPADTEAEKRPDNDATIHDQVLWALYQSGMIGLLHYIISSKHEDKYHMHVLEIISQMLRDQNPSLLAQAEAQRSIVEKTRDEAELLAIRQRETMERQHKIEKYTGLRESHGEKPRIKNYWGSRFAGTYVVKDVKSISNNDLIYHKPLSSLTALELNHDKRKVRKPKNKRAPTDTVVERRSILSVRLFLKEFCIEFLNGAYNTLMYSVKEMIHHGKNQVNDESYYLWAMKFFMEFNRNYKAEMKLVSETMSLSSFHFVQTQIENYQENMLADKKKIFVWGRRMHLALRAYQELLLTLGVMDGSPDPDVRESARIIKSNIFYVVEYRELILFLMVNFNEARFSKSFLKDLIETVHVFMKLLETFCTRSRGIIVQEKQRARKNKQRKKKESNATSQPIVPVASSPEELWNELEPELSSIVESQTEVPDSVVPFDSTSDVPIDEQKVDAVKKIQMSLREKQLENAVGLLRASREVWPENDSFGSPNPAPEEEILALKDIYFADLGQPFVTPVPPILNNEAENEENEEEEEEDEGGGDDDHGGREICTNFSEKTFQFLDFVKRFCHPRVIQACGYLLRDFDQNLPKTNHCLLKLLHRIAWDCKLPAMIFQASIFRTFQRIFDSENPQHKELKRYAIYIIRKFVEVAKVNPKVYIELLFWKTTRDAYDIEYGYGSYQTESQASKLAWTEEEEDELRRLYEEYMSLPEKPEEGILDWIVKNLINNSRSTRGVSKKLREMGFALPASKHSRKSVSTRPPVEWAPEEEEQLTALFHQFKEAYDPLSCILDRLTVKRPKSRVVDKLLAMHLVEDKKELRKKRGKKYKDQQGHSAGNETVGSQTDTDTDGTASSQDSDSDTGDNVPTPRARQKAQHNSAAKKRTKTKQQRSSNFSPPEATQLLGQVRSAGMTDALEWLAESLQDVIEDADDNSDESTPLLPITESCVVAMDTPLFQQLLKSLGITPPADEQESYWRIPGYLNADDLKARKDLIEHPTSEVLFNSEDFERQVAEECRKVISANKDDLDELSSLGDQDNDKEFNSLSSIIKTPKTSGNSNSTGHSSMSVNDNEPTIVSDGSVRSEEINSHSKKAKTKRQKQSKKGKDRKIIGSSESENESVRSEELNSRSKKAKNKTQKQSKKGKDRKMMGSSESDNESVRSEEINSLSKIAKNKTQKQSKKGKVRKVMGSSESEDESVGYEEINSHSEETSVKKQKHSKKKGKVKKVMDSSESENESRIDIMEQDDNENEVATSKRMLDSDSESESPKTKKPRKVQLVSDDED